MNSVFNEYLDTFVLAFLDDILIYSKNEEEHEKNLRMVLKVLGENMIYEKLSKCEFYQKKNDYLGHIILEEGIFVDLENIEAIMNWPTPRSVIDVKSFTGLARYY